MKLFFKYIIVDGGAIIFPDSPLITHKEVGATFPKIYAAGFCQLKYIEGLDIPDVTCNGRSESLDIDSKPKIDQMIVADLFRQVSLIKYVGMSVKQSYEDDAVSKH